jgi:hypothetical protein
MDRRKRLFHMVLSALVSRRLMPTDRKSGPPIFLIAVWWLTTPLCLFLYSRMTVLSVFLPRYLSLMLPGAALCATAAAAFYIPPDRWKQAAAALGLGALIWLGQWKRVWPAHDGSDWRSAALAENRLARRAATPVLCMSPFIESTGPGWNSHYALPGFLYAHLSIYPILGTPYLFPLQPSSAAQEYAVQLASGKLAQAGRFVLFGQSWQVKYWNGWFARRSEFAGWGSAVEDYGDVAVGIFTRQSPIAALPGCRMQRCAILSIWTPTHLSACATTASC